MKDQLEAWVVQTKEGFFIYHTREYGEIIRECTSSLVKAEKYNDIDEALWTQKEFHESKIVKVLITVKTLNL